MLGRGRNSGMAQGQKKWNGQINTDILESDWLKEMSELDSE
jgi:hypothetical protein